MPCARQKREESCITASLSTAAASSFAQDDLELRQCLPASATSQQGRPASPTDEGLCCFHPTHQALQHCAGSWDRAPALAMPRSMQRMGGVSPGAAMALLAALHIIQAREFSQIRLWRVPG